MAIKNLPNFNNQLLSFVHDEVPNTLMRRQIEISLHLLQKIQEKNPVDTGFSRNNWRMSVDNIPTGTIGTYERAVKRQTSGKPPLVARGREVSISSAVYKKGEQLYQAANWKKIGHVVYVFNNVKYVQYLERGHSQQAPKGFIWIALGETRVWMQSKGW